MFYLQFFRKTQKEMFMAALGNVTFKMAYNGVSFFCFADHPAKIKIEKIAVQVGWKETYSDTYFVDFSKLRNGSAHFDFVSATTQKVSDAISAPLEATKAIFVRLEGRVSDIQFAVNAKSELIEFVSGSAHHIFIENFKGKPTVTYPDSKEMLSDDESN
jgi:hypothetical protein